MVNVSYGHQFPAFHYQHIPHRITWEVSLRLHQNNQVQLDNLQNINRLQIYR